MKRLSTDGLLIFSNNQRKFSLNDQALADFTIENKTNWSLDKDFQRSANSPVLVYSHNS